MLTDDFLQGEKRSSNAYDIMIKSLNSILHQQQKKKLLLGEIVYSILDIIITDLQMTLFSIFY